MSSRNFSEKKSEAAEIERQYAVHVAESKKDPCKASLETLMKNWDSICEYFEKFDEEISERMEQSKIFTELIV